jgi:hypothetical protein
MSRSFKGRIARLTDHHNIHVVHCVHEFVQHGTAKEDAERGEGFVTDDNLGDAIVDGVFG